MTDRLSGAAMSPFRLGGIGIMVLPGVVWAHHFMEDQLPQTFAQGLLSGLAHPVIGVDHLAFIVAAGFLLALVRH